MRDLAARRLGRRTATNSTAALRCTLPADAVAFTGRRRQVRVIGDLAAGRLDSGSMVTIHAIDGMPGVGKTALAVHVAHRMARRFPDGQWFLDLHAHTPGQRPVAATDALATLLMGDGVDPRHLPEDLEGRSLLWRDRTATRRVLLVLDNAASSDQVVPLLPTSPHCLVLVTSRRHLGDLPGAVTQVPLDVLSPDQAKLMFLRLAPHTMTDPDAVAELVEVCSRLPLAISLLARVATKHQAWTLRDLITETRARLLSISAESRTVSAAFDLSYAHLPPDRQRTLRYLGLHPGVEFDAHAAAALTGLPVTEAGHHLDGLHGDHLLVEHGYRRYTMHDLIRDYALDLASREESAPERDRAVDRLSEYYRRAAVAAHHATGRRTWAVPRAVSLPAESAATAGASEPDRIDEPDRMALPELGDQVMALAWGRTELPNLLACLTRATDPRRVVGLTAAVTGLLWLDGPWDRAVERHTAAVHAARSLGDRWHEAAALTDLANSCYLVDDYRGAERAFGEALDLYRALDDRHGQADALGGHGRVRYALDDFPAAERALGEALDLYRALDDRRGQADVLTLLGDTRRLATDCTGAAQVLEQALDLTRASGDRYGQADALSILGGVLSRIGEHGRAERCQRQALALHRDLGNTHRVAVMLGFLGDVQRLAGDHEAARGTLLEAVEIARRSGDRNSQIMTLNFLGYVRSRLGEHEQGIRDQREALDLARAIGYRRGEAGCLLYLGAALRENGELQQAVQELGEALDVYRALGDDGDEAETLNELGITHAVLGRPDRAKACHLRSLDLAAELDLPRERAHALLGLARCARADGDAEEVARVCRQAARILHRLGPGEAVNVEAELAHLLADHPAHTADAVGAVGATSGAGSATGS